MLQGIVYTSETNFPHTITDMKFWLKSLGISGEKCSTSKTRTFKISYMMMSKLHKQNFFYGQSLIETTVFKTFQTSGSETKCSPTKTDHKGIVQDDIYISQQK